MSEPLLKIGDTDVSDYITEENMTVSEQAVYDGVSFTNVYGETTRIQTGISVRINAKLSLVPSDVVEDILSECDAGNISVTYAYPAERTGNFERPDVSSTLVFTDADGSMWYYDVSLNLNCPFIALDGL